MRARQTINLELRGVEGESGTIRDLSLITNLGNIRGRLHEASSGNAAIL
jgi:hypothetical protein